MSKKNIRKWVPFAHCFIPEGDDSSFLSNSGSYDGTEGERQGLLSGVRGTIDTSDFQEPSRWSTIMSFLEDSVVTFFKSEGRYRVIDGEDDSAEEDSEFYDTQSESFGYQTGFPCEFLSDLSMSSDTVSREEKHPECCENCRTRLKVIESVTESIINQSIFPTAEKNEIERLLETKEFGKIAVVLRKTKFFNEYKKNLKDAFEAEKALKRVYYL